MICFAHPSPRSLRRCDISGSICHHAASRAPTGTRSSESRSSGYSSTVAGHGTAHCERMLSTA
eukprot:1770108-Rhodomonas_salina.2